MKMDRRLFLKLAGALGLGTAAAEHVIADVHALETAAASSARHLADSVKQDVDLMAVDMLDREGVLLCRLTAVGEGKFEGDPERHGSIHAAVFEFAGERRVHVKVGTRGPIPVVMPSNRVIKGDKIAMLLTNLVLT